MSDGLDLLHDDHRVILDLLDAVEGRAEAPHGVDRPSELLRQLIEKVSIHSAVEREVLYPLLEAQTEGGDGLATSLEADHDRVDDELGGLDLHDLPESEIQARLRALAGDLRRHIDREEQEAFAALRAAVPVDELADLRSRLERAAASAPTHPHPHAHRLPGTAASRVAGVVDRVRDLTEQGR